MIKRIPMILFILTILSLGFLVVVRISAMGTRLLTMGSKVGKFVASSYYSSVIIFVIILAAFIASVAISLYLRNKRHAQKINEEIPE